MNIGYGITVLNKGVIANGVDGIGSYSRELGNALLAYSNLDITPVCFGGAIQDQLLACSLIGFQMGRFSSLAALSTLFPITFPGEFELKGRVDLFHATDHLIPRFRDIPTLATIMDAIPLSHPHWVNKRIRGLKTWAWRRTTRWAMHIITISNFSKEQIVENLEVPEDNITVIPLGVSNRYFEPLEQSLLARVLATHELPSTFFLFVGTLQPRKNILRLLHAHSTLPAEYQKEFPLVIVGRAGWSCVDIIKQLDVMKSNGHVVWLKYLSDIEVRALMQSARALVFPSLYEGFGLPVLEAFASGLPVITSNTTSLPEIATNCALLVDPEDVESIADGMMRMLSDSELSSLLRVKGLERAREMSWANCAEKTVQLYKQFVG